MEALAEPIVWCLMDGKPGHQNQVIGLAEALQRQTPLAVRTIRLPGPLQWLAASAEKLSGFSEQPALIISAGHRTHIPLLILAKRFRSRSVVLMKPSLPLGLFDAALVPSVHRLPRVPGHVFETVGVLNRLQPSDQRLVGCGVCLIGGPSSHYLWDNRNVIRQVSRILQKSPKIDFTVATSRRTPRDFVAELKTACPGVPIVEPDDVDRDWLKNQLSTCEVAWVSEDSVSMTYEAVTSGATVGVVELARRKNSRVTDSIDLLVKDGHATRWSRWRERGQLSESTARFDEATRAAQWLLQKNWLPMNVPAGIRKAA